MLMTERHSDQIAGVISCYDRVVLQGTLPGICYARGMTTWLKINKIRIFDYAKFAEPLRDEIRANAERIANENGLKIDFVRSAKTRKEKRIKKILEERGNRPGLVHIISVMESCPTYKPWHNKQTGETYLRPDQSKCLHYYFYFIDPDIGLCYVRVPTWCPFRLQFYFNGHNWLASGLEKEGIGHNLIDNAFANIGSFSDAQNISDSFTADFLHKKLDMFAARYCPVIGHFNLRYRWSIMQVEYATDIVFHRQQDLRHIYDRLARTAVLTVKPGNIATFLGRKLHPNYKDEMGNNFNTRIEGTRIRHTMGPVSVKLYDKFGMILRIETTVNDVSFFKHHRTVEHRDGSESAKLAPMKKTIYSLSVLQELLLAANRRYLRFISDIDDSSVGIRNLEKISKSVDENSRSYKGFNFFNEDDQALFETIASGEFNISGFRNKNLRDKIPSKNTGQISRILKRLRTHGLIKKIGRTYKYYLTRLGSRVTNMGLKLRELVVIPGLA